MHGLLSINRSNNATSRAASIDSIDAAQEQRLVARIDPLAQNAFWTPPTAGAFESAT
jgi:hypothetical protein